MYLHSLKTLSAIGDGVLQEIYLLFSETFLSQSDEDSEHTIPIIPSLDQKNYVSIGRIITHQFVLWYFPD